MKSLIRGLQFVLTVAVMMVVAPPLLAAEPATPAEQYPFTPLAGLALNHLQSMSDSLAAHQRFAEGWFEAGSQAIKDCDQNKLQEALETLRDLLLRLGGLTDSLGDDQREMERLPADNEVAASLLKQIHSLLSTAGSVKSIVQADIEILNNNWKVAKDECDKQHRTGTGGATITPGSDVAKGHVVFVDPKTQQPIPGGQIVVVPKDPEKPMTATPIGQDGTAEMPSHGPDDTVYFFPQCHQKVTTTGSQVDGNSGVQVSTPSKTMTFIAPGPCSEVTDEMVNERLLASDMELADCKKGEGPDRTYDFHGHSWGAVEEDWGFFRADRYRCVITVYCYGRPVRSVAESLCAMPIRSTGTGTSTDTGTGKPTDGGPTTTIPVEGDQPREIQGPAPTEPYAKSKGSWGQSYPDQWALRAINWLRADGTTVLPSKGAPVIVAVIDTGVDLWHPDLLGAGWVNSELLKKGKLERDSRGYYGDFFGWNFIDGNSNISDKNGHGTVIAGIIAASVGKGFGIAGINPWARIMPLKIMEINGKGGSINLARAVLYAVDHGARVINLSVGGEHLTVTEQAALDYAAEKGVVVVVASGNQGINTADFSPAGLRNALTVAALGPDLKRPSFSNWGSAIAIAAPGVDILSLRARQTDLLMFDKPDYKPGTAVVGGRYYRITGSSFAAPMVSGAASLLFSARPELTGEQVKRMLVQSARNLSGVGKDQFTGYGLLDVEAALAADPEFFIEAEISGVAVAQEAGKTLLRVSGTATANKLKQAWVEAGKGENPTEWKKVSRNLGKPVSKAVIDDLDAGNFQGEKVWILRVIVEHENGRRREGWFRLQIG